MLFGASRPPVDPAEPAGENLLLAYRDGLSDERAMEAVRFDLRWKVALDLPVDHPGFHPTSLVRFRARLLLHGMERFFFERSLELATELGLLEGEAEQIVDSTPMLGAAAVQDTATWCARGSGSSSTPSRPVTVRLPGSSPLGFASTIRARGRSRRATGTTRPLAWSSSPRLQETPSARCGRSSGTTS
ncbi:MAG: transposase [Thermoleophilaceae bacterium]|nr:transposase [Thermoleophilaceae bacterium]